MIPSITDLAPQIVALMQAENIPLRDPVSATAFAEFEQNWNVEIPPEMRTFYEIMDGTSRDFGITRDLFCIWPLSEVKPIPALLPEPVYAEYRDVADAPRILCFSDYLINSDVFAVRTVGDCEIISVCNGHKTVAASMGDFMHRLLVDPISLM